jgi:preprotein translocase subunit SecG
LKFVWSCEMSNVWNTLLLTVQMLSALAMIGLILVQQGKGADMGAAFGSGSGGAGSLFGASGSANFLSRSTAVLATLFLASTLILSYINGVRPASANSVLERAATPATAPTTTVPTPAAIPGTVNSGAQAIPGTAPAAPAATGAAPAAPATAPAGTATK